MKHGLENIWQTVWRRFPIWIDATLFVNLLVILGLVSLATVYFEWAEGDIAEHIQASFLVHQGVVPYRDFFEHHHPLLWYLFAPVVGLLERNIHVFGVVNYITFLFFVIGLVFLYKVITEFLSGRTAALLSVLMLLAPGIFLYYVYFKPDNYMFTCVMAGIYYLFCYMRDKKRRDLIFSYAAFWVAFLFCQKALFYFPLVAVWSGWFLYTREMKWHDLGSAIIFPLASAACLALYLWSAGLWDVYYQMNFAFNREMVDLFGDRRINRAWDIANIMFGAAIFSGIALYKYMGRYFRCWVWLFVLIYASKVFYFSPHVYYYYEAYFFAVPLAAVGVMKLAEKWKILLLIVFVEIQCYLIYMGMCFYNDIVYKYRKTVLEYLWEQTNRCDYVLTGNGGILFLFSKTPEYYWFIPGRLPIVGAKIGLHDYDDYDALIQKYRPKFIWVDDIKSFFDEEQTIYTFNKEVLDKLYEPTEIVNDGKWNFELQKEVYFEYPRGLYRLKKEYIRRDCVKDEKTGVWQYGKN